MDLYKAYCKGFFVPRCIWNWKKLTCICMHASSQNLYPPVKNFWLRAWPSLSIIGPWKGRFYVPMVDLYFFRSVLAPQYLSTANWHWVDQLHCEWSCVYADPGSDEVHDQLALAWWLDVSWIPPRLLYSTTEILNRIKIRWLCGPVKCSDAVLELHWQQPVWQQHGHL